MHVEVSALAFGHNGRPVSDGVTFRAEPGRITLLMGANGSGKTTLLKTIAGLLPPLSGEIRFAGRRVNDVDGSDRVKLGMALVPEGRRLFSRLKVAENLQLGTVTNRDPKHRAEMFERVYRLFPILKERAAQRAGTFSGGQQQMLAIGRALMSRPKFLMLDEPSLGIAPLIIEQIFDALRQLHQQEGLTMLLVEQNVPAALSLADRGYVLQTGRIVLEGTGQELLNSDLVRKAYLGI